MALDDEIRRLAGRQYSVIGRSQVRAWGGNRWWEAHRVGNGAWRRATDRVLVLNGSAPSGKQQLMIGLCDAGEGATLSHHSAAWLWGLYGFAPTPVHVTALRGTYRRPGLTIVHEPRRLFPHHITFAEGFAVTSIVRTVFDLATSVHVERLKRTVHAVVRRSPGTLPIFHQMLEELAVRGRPGIAKMRLVLGALPIGSVPAGSGNELRFEEILERYGEPIPRRQVSLGGHEFVGRVDYLDDDLDLVFEIDGRDFHELLPDDREHDERRDASLADIGKKVVRIREVLLWRDPAEVLRIVRRERAIRRAELVAKP